MGEERQNRTGASSASEGRFREQEPRRDGEDRAVRQGRTDVVTRRPAGDRDAWERRASAAERRADGSRQPSGRQGNPPDASERQESPRQMVVGRPKSEKPPEKKPTVVIDSPNIDSPKAKKRRDSQKEADGSETPIGSEGKKFYFQRFRDISMLRRLLMLVFVLLFLWCLAPMFFHIINIGVLVSSAVMLCVFLTALFWHLIDRNWNFKKAALCLFAALVFAASVTAFGIVSGMMLKASLTVPPSDNSHYTLVVLGCKAHGDQPSWMLHDRLEKAYAVLRENPGVKCVVTGGKGEDESFTEAYVMKKYLTKKGISADRIYMEELAASTEENLLYTKALVRLNGLPEDIMIVTDRFHELRARIWAERSGFRHIYSACCETRLYLVTGYWFREMFGLARLYVFGR